jgi:hypothetical protein
VILLTAAQASEVQGVSAVTPLAALHPMPLTDGRFYLGAEVLTDPAHADKLAILSTLPTADFSTIASLIPQAKT